MLRYRTQGALAVGLGILAAGCFDDPTLKTNLRPEGPPQVLAVLAVDPVVTGAEEAAFCRYEGTALDDKAPGLVQGTQVCAETADDFTAAGLFPLGWDIRIVFDELLNGDAVEELICDVDGDGVQDDPIETCDGTIANTRPVSVTCGGTTVNYDGYYYPNGNKESFPVGPAIVIIPDPADLTFPTGTECTIVINDVVVDKQGEHVDVDMFTISVQELAIFDHDPVDAAAVEDRGVIAPDGAVGFSFNADLDPASVDATDFEVLDANGAVVASVDFAVDAFYSASDGIFIFSTDAAGFAPGQYTARLKSGAMFTELNGGTVTLTENDDIRFVVE